MRGLGRQGRLRPTRSRGLTDRGRALLGAGVLLAAGGLLLGFLDLTRIGLFCLAMPIVTRWVTWRRRPRLAVERSLEPAPLVAGRPGRISLTVRNVGPRGCDPLAAAEPVSPWLGSTARRVLPPLRPGEETTGGYDVRPTRRGRHLAGPLRVVGRDALGLTHLSTAVGSALEVLVLPPVHDLSGGDPIGLGMGHEGDAPASVLAGSEHDVSVREYRQGDDLRRVHWGVTAHRGRLMVRHEALPRLRRAVLLLDASAPTWGLSLDARPRPPGESGESGGSGASGASADQLAAAARRAADADPGAAFEWAVETLASIAAHLAGLGFTLHLVVAGGTPSEAGRAEDPARPLLLDDVLTRLALAMPGGTASPAAAGDRAAGTEHPAAPLSGSLSATAREVAGAGGLVVLVTGDRSPHAAHETFGVLRTGLAGLAVVVDTGAFARAAGRDWWLPKETATDGSAPGRSAAAPRVTDGEATTHGDEGTSEEARRLCAYARSGGWRAVPAGASTTPAVAWSRLLGGPRAWVAAPDGPEAARPRAEATW